MFDKEIDVDGERIKMYIWLVSFLLTSCIVQFFPSVGTLWELNGLIP